MTTHTADCAECDFRVAKVPAQDWPDGATRPIYLFSSACEWKVPWGVAQVLLKEQDCVISSSISSTLQMSTDLDFCPLSPLFSGEPFPRKRRLSSSLMRTRPTTR